MTKRDKQLAKLLSKPATFKWRELCGVLSGLGFSQLEGSGSRVKFYHKETSIIINLHNPHPENTVPEYAIRRVAETLIRMGYKS